MSVAGTSTSEPSPLHATVRLPAATAIKRYVLILFMCVINKINGNVISRVLCPSAREGLYHQSRAVVADGLNQPTPRQRAGRPCAAGIFGFSTHKVCHRAALLPHVVGSYPALAPLPEVRRFVFLWHLLSAGRLPPRRLPVRKYGDPSCPDFPPAAPWRGLPAIESVAVKSCQSTLFCCYIQNAKVRKKTETAIFWELKSEK